MKSFLLTLLSIAVLAVVAAVFIFDVFSFDGGHDRDRSAGNGPVPFASYGKSREQYIAYLLRTNKHNDPELWQRIAAARNLKDWPKR